MSIGELQQILTIPDGGVAMERYRVRLRPSTRAEPARQRNLGRTAPLSCRGCNDLCGFDLEQSAPRRRCNYLCDFSSGRGRTGVCAVTKAQDLLWLGLRKSPLWRLGLGKPCKKLHLRREASVSMRPGRALGLDGAGSGAGPRWGRVGRLRLPGARAGHGRRDS